MGKPNDKPVGQRFEQEVKPRLRGEAHEIRFAGYAVLCFQYREDAEKVMDVLPNGLPNMG